MTQQQRHSLRHLMRAAWALARMGADRFGGRPSRYIVSALRLVWQDRKTPALPVFRKGLGMQMRFPGLPVLEQVVKGQTCLPGIALR